MREKNTQLNLLILTVILFIVISLMNYFSQMRLSSNMNELKEENNRLKIKSNTINNEGNMARMIDELKRKISTQQDELENIKAYIKKEVEEKDIKKLNEEYVKLQKEIAGGDSSNKNVDYNHFKRVDRGEVKVNYKRGLKSKEKRINVRNLDTMKKDAVEQNVNNSNKIISEDEKRDLKEKRKDLFEKVNIISSMNEDPYNRKFSFPNKRFSNTIFVSIASYNDEICPHTLNEMFEMAEDKERIFVGLVQQNEISTTDCIEKYCEISKSKCRRDQIRSIKMNSSQSKGVVPTRYLVSTLYKGEEFFFQIDAHTQFVRKWDSKVIGDWKMIGYDRAVLSTHPLSHRMYKEEDLNVMSNLCNYNWDKDDLPRFRANIINKITENVTSPSPNVFIGAGLVFSRGDFLKDCPFDPNYEFLFSGEELLLSACLFTNGWDIYNPHTNIIFHYYGDEPRRKKIKLPSVQSKKEISLRRLNHILRWKNDTQIPHDDVALRDIDQYPLGQFRSLDSFWDYSDLRYVREDLDRKWCRMSDKSKFATIHQQDVLNYPFKLHKLPILD